MYKVTDAVECLKNRIGFLATKDIEDNNIDPDLRISDSGTYWEEGHALITIENLCSIKPEEKDFNDWANEKVEASIKKLLSAVTTKKLNNKVVKSKLVSEMQLFHGSVNRNFREIKQSRFVGYQIKPKNQNGMILDIKKIGTQFSQANPDLTLYVYNTSQILPVAEITLNAPDEHVFKWHNQPIEIPSQSSQYDSGILWYIGYYEDDLQGVAYNKVGLGTNMRPCATCDTGVYALYNSWSKYMDIAPISISASNVEPDRTLFDTTLVDFYYSDKTFGLNFQFDVNCDITSLICSQVESFDSPLLTQFAVDMLEEIANSTNVNRIQEVTKQKAMFQLSNQANGQKGLREVLADKIEALNFDFSDMGTACLPCAESKGVRYGSI